VAAAASTGKAVTRLTWLEILYAANGEGSPTSPAAGLPAPPASIGQPAKQPAARYSCILRSQRAVRTRRASYARRVRSVQLQASPLTRCAGGCVLRRRVGVAPPAVLVGRCTARARERASSRRLM
jgi:hypothetical protein